MKNVQTLRDYNIYAFVGETEQDQLMLDLYDAENIEVLVDIDGTAWNAQGDFIANVEIIC